MNTNTTKNDKYPYKFDGAILYYKTGSPSVKCLSTQLTDLRLFPYEVIDNATNYEEAINQFLVEATLLIVILSKDVLKQPAVVYALEKAGFTRSLKVVLVHDPATCYFPGPTEQPPTVQHHFSEKAVTFLADYASTAADAIRKHLHEKLEEGVKKVDTTYVQAIEEDIHTRCFLSHKRLTAQGIAGRLYEGLKGDYRCFLDSEAHFKIHDLERIVEKTDVFICILSVGYLDSEWCVKELKMALKSGKKILIVREYMYVLPEIFPEELKDVEQVLRNSLTYSWMAEYNAQCVAKVKEFLGVPDKFLERMNKWVKDNQVEGVKITYKDSYSLNLSTLGDLEVGTFLHGLIANFDFPLSQLRVLNLKKTQLKDDDCVWFKSLPELINLNAANTKLSSVGLKRIVDSCPNLEILDVSECNINGEALFYVADKLPSLQSLNITYCLAITDDELQQFKSKYPDMKIRA